MQHDTGGGGGATLVDPARRTALRVAGRAVAETLRLRPAAPLPVMRDALVAMCSREIDDVALRIVLDSAGGWCIEADVDAGGGGSGSSTAAARLPPHGGGDDAASAAAVAAAGSAAAAAARWVEGCPLSAVDRAAAAAVENEEDGGPRQGRRAAPFALSFAALKAACAAAHHKPAFLAMWQLRVPRPRRLPRGVPSPMVTVFETGDDGGGKPAAFREVALLVLAPTGLSDALSLARSAAERVRRVAVEDAAGEGGWCGRWRTAAIGARGGFVVRRTPLATLLDALRAAIEASVAEVPPAVAAACRVKVFVDFGGGSGSGGVADVVDTYRSLAREGLLHGVIGPFDRTRGREEAWAALRAAGVACVTDGVVDDDDDDDDDDHDGRGGSGGGSAAVDAAVVDVVGGFASVSALMAAVGDPKLQSRRVVVRGQAAAPPDAGMLAQCAVAAEADWAMFGGLFSGERTEQYNELLRAEEWLRDECGVLLHTPVPDMWL